MNLLNYSKTECQQKKYQGQKRFYQEVTVAVAGSAIGLITSGSAPGSINGATNERDKSIPNSEADRFTNIVY